MEDGIVGTKYGGWIGACLDAAAVAAIATIAVDIWSLS